MQIISHQSQLNALSPSLLKSHLIAQYEDLVETKDDQPAIFIIVEENDAMAGPDFAFVSDNGLFGEDDDPNPYEAVTHLPDLNMFELLHLAHGEDARWIYVPETVVAKYPEFSRMLRSPQLFD